MMNRNALRVLLTAAAVSLAACSREGPPPVNVAPPPSPSPVGAPPPSAAPAAAAPSTAGAAPAAEPAPANTPGLSRLGELNLLVGEYINQIGQAPRSFEELVAKKFIASVPAAPPGKRYQIKVVDSSRAEVVLVNK